VIWPTPCWSPESRSVSLAIQASLDQMNSAPKALQSRVERPSCG